MLLLNLRDRDRLVVLRKVAGGELTQRQAAGCLGLSIRQMRRLQNAYREEGDAAVVHGNRGRRPNNAFPEAVRLRALERAGEPQFHDFRPTLLAEHLSRDPEIGPLKAPTLRKWLIEAELWAPRRRGRRHRRSRPRRAAFGEMIQMDTSDHAWLEARYAGPIALIKMVDDATNRIVLARFVPRDNGAANRQMLVDYLIRFGRPLALYTDRAGHFGNARRTHGPVPLEEREYQETSSIIRRALDALNVRLIRARSPQAKGRVERDFGTSQDRLIKELRIAGVVSMDDANLFLQERYIPFWNERFAVAPAEPRDAHRPLPRRTDLGRLFARTQSRVVSNAFTLRWKNSLLQIQAAQASGIRPRDRVTVEERLDGSTRFRWNDRYFTPSLLHDVPPPARARRKATTPPTPSPRSRTAKPPERVKHPRNLPSPNHPWRRTAFQNLDTHTPSAPRRAPSSPP